MASIAAAFIATTSVPPVPITARPAWRSALVITSVTLALLAVAALPTALLADDSLEVDTRVPLHESFAWRETFLPPGVPSVALRTNETAILWNPAGIAMGSRYSAGYAYTAVYSGDSRETGTHYILTNTSGLGFGVTKDNIGDGTRTRMLFTVAPRFSDQIAVGWTGKWRGAFNFDVGAMLRLQNLLSLGFVGRDLRETQDARTYYETGAAWLISPNKFGVFYDVIIEDNTYRKATAHGGGFYVGFDDQVFFMGTLHTDGDGNTFFRFMLQLYSPTGLLEGSYMNSSNDFKALSGRFSRWVPQ